MTHHLRLGVVTDPHLAPADSPPRRFFNDYPFDRSLAMLDATLAWFATRDVDAIAVLGDLVMFEDDDSLDAGLTRLAAVDKPILIVPGNHDGIGWPAAVERNLATAPLPSWPTIVRAADVRVESGPDRWLTGGLQVPAGGPTLILSHFPVINVRQYLTDAGYRYAGDATWDDSIIGIEDRSDPTVVLSGHVHVRYELATGSVLQLGNAALIEPPHAAAIVELSGNDDTLDVSIEHASMAPYDVELVPIISPERSTWRFRDRAWEREP